jgi:Bacteriophage head to tail connecting protein.
MADLEKLKQLLSRMETERYGFASHWQEIVDYILWFRQNIVSNGPAGDKKTSKINDGSGTYYAMLFAAGFAAKNVNPAMPWFQLQAEDDAVKDSREVRLWLDGLQRLFYDVFRKSNFYTADKESTIDWACFGTSALFVGPHPRWGCHFQNVNLGEVFLAVNQYDQVDTLFRKFEFTAQQIVQQWGEGKVSGKVRELIKNSKPHDKVMLVHAVQPRLDRDPRKLDNRNLPFESTYFEYDNNHLLEESGYPDFPYCVPRYIVMKPEVYGRGLGMMALPDVKELQVRVRDTTRAGQLQLEPPILLADDGFAGSPIKRIPGGYTFAKSEGRMQDKIGVFPTAGNLAWSEEGLDGLRRRIGQTFYADLMSVAMDKQVTLGEFMEVAQEKMQFLGDALTRRQDEMYKPLFDRVFQIYWEAGKIPMPPRELIGEDGSLKFKVEYISAMARAQKRAESQGIIQAAGFIGQVAQARGPEALDVLDWDGAQRIVLENYGVPQRLIVDPKQVSQVRQARAQAAQEEKMAAMALETAKTMPALSKGAEPGSPLDQLDRALNEGAGNA